VTFAGKIGAKAAEDTRRLFSGTLPEEANPIAESYIAES